jgi:cell wall-associated NlpC family hydrolase
VATSRFAVRLAALTVAALSTVGSVTLVPVAYAADPSERTKVAQAELDRLTDQVDIAVEDFNEGRIALVKVQRAAERARGRVTAAQVRLKGVQDAIGTVAASAYRSGTGDRMLQLMTSVSEPAAFLDKASALDHVARSNAERLRDLRAARRELAATQADANRAYAAEQATQRKLTKTRDLIVAAVARQEKLVATLVTADERAAAARAAAEQRAAAALLAHKREVASLAAKRSRLLRASRNNVRSAPESNGAGNGDSSAGGDPGGDVPVTGRGAVAVRFAYAQIGKPYSWGQDGMSSYDCSGLTSRAWAAAGVSLSHSSRAQAGEGRRVSRSELQPGDLVFFGSPIHHVGIYVGGGQMINAPQSGDTIGVRNAFRGDYAGAVRPG